MMNRMDTSPKVFVIVLNKDGRECLPACLEGIFHLSYSNLEAVVVDNASRDGSLEEAKARFSRAHFILNTENLGFAAGMNVGIRYAMAQGAQYVWLLNNDAVPGRDALAALVLVAENAKAPALISPLVLDSFGKTWFAAGRIDYLRMRALHVATEANGNEPYETEYLSGCALFLPRKAVEQVGLLDEKYFLYYEDADFSFRAHKAGFHLLVAPKSVVVHSERSESGSEKVYWLVRSGIRFFRLHTPIVLRPWVMLYLMLRKVKNALDVYRGKSGADRIARAYADSARED